MSTPVILAVHEMSDQAIKEVEAAEHGPILGDGFPGRYPGRFAQVGSDAFADYCDFVRTLDLNRAQRRGDA